MNRETYSESAIMANLTRAQNPGALWVPRNGGPVTWARATESNVEIRRDVFESMLSAGLVVKDATPLNDATNIFVAAPMPEDRSESEGWPVAELRDPDPLPSR